MADTVLAFAPDVVLQIIDREAVVLKLADETAFALNETGARIAQLIAAGARLSEVVDTLAAEYTASKDEVARAVTDLVRTLEAKHLVTASRDDR